MDDIIAISMYVTVTGGSLHCSRTLNYLCMHADSYILRVYATMNINCIYAKAHVLKDILHT